MESYATLPKNFSSCLQRLKQIDEFFNKHPDLANERSTFKDLLTQLLSLEAQWTYHLEKFGKFDIRRFVETFELVDRIRPLCELSEQLGQPRSFVLDSLQTALRTALKECTDDGIDPQENPRIVALKNKIRELSVH